MRVVIHRLKSSYWTPRQPDYAYRFICSVLVRGLRRTKRPVLIVLSEKPLRVLFGHIYDEQRIRTYRLSRAITQIMYYKLWCGLLRRLLPTRMQVLCNVKADDICKHKHYAATQCLFDILSLLKPFSECGVDVSMLPYTYALRVRDNIKIIVDRLYRDLLRITKRKLIGIAVVDSDFSLIPRRFKYVVITGRRAYIPCALDLGFLTYLLGRIRGTRKLFIKSPTLICYTGVRVNIIHILLIVKKVHKYLESAYGTNVIENALAVEASDYKSISWRTLASTVNYPVALVEFQ